MVTSSASLIFNTSLTLPRRLQLKHLRLPGRRQVEGIQRIAAHVVGSVDADPFVLADLSGSGEQHIVSSDVVTIVVVQFHRFYTRLLPVQIQRHLGNIEVERISSAISIERVISDETDDYAR